MADNITAPGAGSVLAFDDVAGVMYPRTKISFGADGAASDVTTVNRLPVDPGTVAVTGTFWQATQPVSGTITANAGSGTFATAPVAGENHIGQVGGYCINASATFTRPADTTAYASGDLVANSTTAGSVAPMTLTVARKAAGSVQVIRAKVRKTTAGLTGAVFRVHLFNSSTITATNGDNGAFLTSASANYLGYVDVTMDEAFSDGAVGYAGYTQPPTIKLASGTDIYALLEARGAYTPGNAEQFTLTLEVIQG